MTTVAILQSNYIPWKGYFDLIHDVDEFIFLDDVQFTKRDWRTRNCVKTRDGLQWLTIPAGSNSNKLICEIDIKENSWQAKHHRTLLTNYAKSPYFDFYESMTRHFYIEKIWTNLSDFNQELIKIISRELGILTKFSDSRIYNVSGEKENRILNLLEKVGATKYISGPAARNYLNESSFKSAGIELIWKDYEGYPEYQQRYSNFDHRVTILDLLFNVGPSAPWYIWGWRENKKLE